MEASGHRVARPAPAGHAPLNRAAGRPGSDGARLDQGMVRYDVGTIPPLPT